MNTQLHELTARVQRLVEADRDEIRKLKIELARRTDDLLTSRQAMETCLAQISLLKRRS